MTTVLFVLSSFVLLLCLLTLVLPEHVVDRIDRFLGGGE